MASFRSIAVGFPLGVLALVGSGCDGRPATKPAASGAVVDLGGGGPAAVVAPAPVAAVVDDETLLDVDPRDRFPLRAKVGKIGAFAVASGEPLAAPTGTGSGHAPGFEVVVVDERKPGRVRIVAEHYGVRYVLHIAHADLAEVARERSRLAQDDALTPPAGDSGVDLTGGTLLRRLEVGDGVAQVEVSLPGLSCKGWLPTARIARTYEEDVFDLTKLAGDLEPLGRLEILDAPNGAFLATFDPESARGHRLVARGEATNGFRAIELTLAEARVRGFVTAASVQSKPDLSVSGYGYGTGWGASHTRFLRVPAGTVFRRTPDGPPMAKTLDETVTIVLVEDPSGGVAKVGIRTPWGQIQGYHRCAAVAAIEGSAYRFACVEPIP